MNVTQPVGNIFLTNIHRIYAGEDIPPSPDDDDCPASINLSGRRQLGCPVVACWQAGFIVVSFFGLLVVVAGFGVAFAIALRLDVEDGAVMHQAVDSGNGHGAVGEDMLPVREGLIGCHDHAAGFVTV